MASSAAMRIVYATRNYHPVVGGAEILVQALAERHAARGQHRHRVPACDVYAVSSITDSFGQTYLEAWPSGRPVIGARVPAIESGA